MSLLLPVAITASHVLFSSMLLAASPLATLQWKARAIVVFGQAGNPTFRAQLAELDVARKQAYERDIVVIGVAGDKIIDGIGLERVTAAAIRSAYDVAPDAFKVLLIGKDGGVKFRSDNPVSPAWIFDLIDSMPMRRDEMKKR